MAIMECNDHTMPQQIKKKYNFYYTIYAHGKLHLQEQRVMESAW